MAEQSSHHQNLPFRGAAIYPVPEGWIDLALVLHKLAHYEAKPEQEFRALQSELRLQQSGTGKFARKTKVSKAVADGLHALSNLLNSDPSLFKNMMSEWTISESNSKRVRDITDKLTLPLNRSQLTLENRPGGARYDSLLRPSERVSAHGDNLNDRPSPYSNLRLSKPLHISRKPRFLGETELSAQMANLMRNFIILAYKGGVPKLDAAVAARRILYDEEKGRYHNLKMDLPSPVSKVVALRVNFLWRKYEQSVLDAFGARRTSLGWSLPRRIPAGTVIELKKDLREFGWGMTGWPINGVAVR